MDKPQYLPIKEIIDETSCVKTFYFQYPLTSQPGQFVMLCVHGIDQKPFSIAYDDGQKFGLTIFKRGPLTEKLFTMQVGDHVGITGPYGTSFSIKPDTHYIMVAGGYGAAPLGYLAAKLSSLSCHPERSEGSLSSIDFLMGARGVQHLLFEQQLIKIPNLKLHIATDDGSKGHKGFVTDLLNVILSEAPACHRLAKGMAGRKDPLKQREPSVATLVVTCGPELMGKKVLDACNQYNVDCEVNIERYMKCGYGVCGQCAVDPIGICMCTQGPVVNRELANQITEFGADHRDKSGKIVKF